MPKPTQKDLWKAQILEFFHNYFIGISNLECSEENCPLVLNWGGTERKLSKKGKCVFLKITKDKFLVVDILNYELNGLEEPVKVTIQYRDGTQALVRTKEERMEILKNLTEQEQKKLSFVDPSEVVCFFNNPTHTPNLLDAESIYLDDLWQTKERIKWDQKASKKKIINWVEQKVDGEDKAYKIDQWENDYIFNIYDPDITNSIKDHEVYSAPNNKEREQLWTDYKEEFSELRRVYGIRHLTSKKEERQNNPEIELNEAQFIALEREKKRERMKSIREVEEKKLCSGEHILTYGTSFENREEKVLEMEELEEMKEEPEQKPQQNQAILINDQ